MRFQDTKNSLSLSSTSSDSDDNSEKNLINLSEETLSPSIYEKNEFIDELRKEYPIKSSNPTDSDLLSQSVESIIENFESYDVPQQSDTMVEYSPVETEYPSPPPEPSYSSGGSESE